MRRYFSITPVAPWVLAVGLAASSACFYFSGINEKPRPRIEVKTPGPYTIQSRIEFSGSGSQDDGFAENLRAEWTALLCNTDGRECEPFETALRPRPWSTFTIIPPDKGAIRAKLTLIDKSGASETITSSPLTVVNVEPVIELQVSDALPDPGDLGGFILGLPVEFAVLASDPDGDPLELTWNLEAPVGGGSNPDNVTFEPLDEEGTIYRLVGDVAGVWEVSVSADDGDGGVATQTKQVVFAPDGPPCVGARAPAAGAGDVVFVSGAPKAFAVLTASDALDPWPAHHTPHPLVGTTTFSWSVATPATGETLQPLAGHTLSELVINPADHSKGDHLTVRVELSDRLGLPVSCAAAEPTCSAAGNACSQRMTWEIEIR